MKLAVLFSGGKDSHLAMYKASKHHEIACAITMRSQNSYSYMFQSLGHEYTKIQLNAQNIPQLIIDTFGEKEKELQDLKQGIIKAINEYKIDGIVTGAILSTYQSSRIQQICDELHIWCYNPLWQLDEKTILKDLEEFEVVLLGVFAYPLKKELVGKKLDAKTITKLLDFQEKYQISAIGEGGEFESFVLNGPLYTKKLSIDIKEITQESENCVYVKDFNIN